MPVVYEWGLKNKIEGIDVSMLNNKQKAFVGYWTIHRNQTWAAKQAAYSHPNKEGSRLANTPKIKKILAKLERKLESKTEVVKMNDVVRNLNLSLNRNLEDLSEILPILAKIPPQCYPFIDGIEVTPVYDLVDNGDGTKSKEVVGETVKLKMMSNKDAMDMAMKHLGGYAAEKVTQKVEIEWDDYLEPKTVEEEIEEVEE